MSERRITKIPLPGGSGLVPAGAMQFLDDWPCLFLRGDYAVVLMARIRILAEKLGHHEDPAIFSTIVTLSKLADMIDQDVLFRTGDDA